MIETVTDRQRLRADAQRALRAGKLSDAFAAFADVLNQGPDTVEKKILSAYAFKTEHRVDQIALMFASALLAEGDVDSASMLYQLVRRQLAAGCDFFVTTPHASLPDYCAARGYPVAFKPRCDLVTMTVPPSPQPTARSFVCGLPGGRVLGQSYVPVSADGHLFLEQVIFNPIRAFSHDAGDTFDCLSVPAENRYLVRAASTARYGTAILVGDTPNAGHWLFNNVMALVMALSEPALKHLPVIVSDSPTRLNIETLARLGIGADRMISLKRGQLATFDMLWVPSQLVCGLGTVSSQLHWSPAAMRDMRAALGITEVPPGPRRLFLTRRGAKWRRLVNEDEVFHALEPFGFELVEVADWSLAQQIAAACDAEIIVGAYGAAMALTFLARTQTKVVELCFPGLQMMTHAPISVGIGQPYFRVYGQSLGGGRNVGENDFSISPDDVTKTVMKALLDTPKPA